MSVRPPRKALRHLISQVTFTALSEQWRPPAQEERTTQQEEGGEDPNGSLDLGCPAKGSPRLLRLEPGPSLGGLALQATGFPVC